MNFNRLKNWSVLFALLTLTACGFDKSEQKTEKTSEEDFKDFYTKFHEDSLFQINRIDFPLSGETTYLSPAGKKATYWYKDDWAMQTLLSDTMQLNQKFIRADSIMVDIIYDNDGVGLTRYFSVRDNQWYLTFYSEHNPIDSELLDLE